MSRIETFRDNSRHSAVTLLVSFGVEVLMKPYTTPKGYARREDRRIVAANRGTPDRRGRPRRRAQIARQARAIRRAERLSLRQAVRFAAETEE